jgi:hypothetical protein
MMNSKEEFRVRHSVLVESVKNQNSSLSSRYSMPWSELHAAESLVGTMRKRRSERELNIQSDAFMSAHETGICYVGHYSTCRGSTVSEW